MRSLKIGYVLDDTLDSTDGVQQYILTLGQWMSSQGHHVHYLVGQSDRSDIPHIHSLSRNMKVRFNGNRMSMPLPGGRRLIKELLETEQFDILHVQMPYSPFMAQAVIQSAPAPTAVIGTFHIAPNSRLVSAANRLLGIWTNGTTCKMQTILSVSQAAQKFAKATYGIDSSILPNVVDTDRFRTATPYYPDSPTVQLLFLGRLVERKGCMILLQALDTLNKAGKLHDVRLTICGRGPLEQQLRAFVAEHSLDTFVSFAGYVDDEQKARYLKSADMAIFPSTGGESFGIVLIEAMAAEHPVVVGAANAGYASVLQPFPQALVRVGDAAALAAAIEGYFGDEQLRDRALSWQKEYVRQFDVTVVGTELVAIYRQALHRPADVQ